MNCKELRNLSADIIDEALEALREIVATEDEYPVPSNPHAKCVSIAGDSLRKIGDMMVDARSKIKEADTCTAKNSTEAKFVYFKQTGKYYTEGSGICPKEVFDPYLKSNEETRQLICDANGGHLPGLFGTASDFFVVVTPPQEIGWTILLQPEAD